MQKKSDSKIYFALCLWTLMLSVYLLIRMNIVSVHNVDINILGQMEWFDLIDEIITTAFITPLYCLLKGKDSRKNGFSFLLSFGVYFLFTVVISLYIGNISAFMNADIVNIVYYGIMYVMFQMDVFDLNIYFIIHLFGLGMAVHMLVSILLYLVELRNRSYLGIGRRN